VPQPEFLLDTGPLVAYLSPRDQHHAWAIEMFDQITTPVITCEPVLTEAFYMVSPAHDGVAKLAEFCQPEYVRIDFRLLEHMAVVNELMRKYRDVPMDLADACLVLLAEEHPGAVVVTTDRDFQIYRTRNRRQIRVLAPFA
jgi:uncharacterized protein